MNSCEEVWYQDRELEVVSSDWDHCSQILSQACPSPIRILQAIKFISPEWHYRRHMLKIHFLLNLSWDELRTAICSLRPLIHNKEEGLLNTLSTVALDPTLFPLPFDLIMWDLACSSLHVMQQILRGKLDKSTL
jgi:hypothetical protein